MTRQKLPDGWEYTGDNRATGDHPYNYVEYQPALGLVISNAGVYNTLQTEPSVALAVIRNAVADPVYEAAKRLVSEGPKGFGANFTALRTLIESMEES